MRLKVTKDTIVLPLIFLAVFYGIAFWRYFSTGKIFYIFNFCYIGTSLALGIFLSGALPKEKLRIGRQLTQLFIGSYLLFYVGIFRKEDLQMEGFWFYLFSGVFAGATLHYFIAKIVGPFIFGRGWCGWACWTAMIMDFLPWRTTQSDINTKATYTRYIHFFIILGISVFLFFCSTFGKKFYQSTKIELYWVVFGNIIYYCIALILAIILKDNRAFCKYICPIPVFQKVGSKFSLLKMEIDPKKCIDCKKCEQNCPMQIKLLEYKNNGMRIMSTECILCQTCSNLCPMNAINATFKIDRKKRRLTTAST